MPHTDDSELRTASCASVAASGAAQGAMSGLVAGTVYGVIAEKKFILQNVFKEHHKREPPMALFSIMIRGATAAATVAIFLGVLGGVSCCCSEIPMLASSEPLYAGVAGTCAGAARTAMRHETLRPPLMMQRSLASGALAAAAYGILQMTSSDD